MRFSTIQYDTAIQALEEAKKQLKPDGNPCTVCGDGGHMAFECGHNPLVAVEICHVIAEKSEQLHETLHWLAGHDQAFGVQLGPRRVIAPG